MARTRSQPMSPGSYVSLDDIPSQRRATRSVSAQPEESQVPQTASEPKATSARRGSKARGGSRAKATRGRKKSVRQSARTVKDEVEHQDADQSGLRTGETDAHAGSPHDTQDTEAFEHTAGLSKQHTSDSVLPSVEKNDIEDAQVPNAADTYNGTPLGKKRKTPASPMASSNRTPRRSRTVKTPQQTPFRHTRVPYAQINQQRRDEASGQLTRTLFQLDKLVAPSEIAGGGSITANPATPQLIEPRTPMTAPAPGTNRLSNEELVTRNPTTTGNSSPPATEAIAANPPASAGLVKSFFNDVTRRWTTLRGRITGSQPADAQIPAVHPANVMPSPSFPGLPATSQTEMPSPNPPSPSMTPSRPYSHYPSGLDPEHKARCFERSAAKVQTEPAASSPAKRKREASPPPMKIPNPPGCSYGMDLEYFYFTEEEIEEEERRQAEEQKRLAEEAENAEAGAPSLKKPRTNPSYPTRRSAIREKARTPAKSSTLISPSKQPGFNRNPRRTYAPPELETIISSGLFLESDTDVDAPATTAQNPSPPQTATDSRTTQPPQPLNPWAPQLPPTSEPNRQATQPQPQDPQNVVSKPHLTNAEQEHTSTNAEVSDSEEASPLSRARTKAEQFKPKTPSRLRESHRFSSSMTRSSPSTPNEIDTSATGRSEPKSDLNFSSSVTRPSPSTLNEIVLGPENHTESKSDPDFRYMEDMEETCDAEWLYKQCPSGDLRQVKLPEKESFDDQMRAHGFTDEDIRAANELRGNPVQQQNDLNAMRTAFSTSMSKPLGAPIDFSAFDSRPQ